MLASLLRTTATSITKRTISLFSPFSTHKQSQNQPSITPTTSLSSKNEENLLSEKALSMCSDLMRRILTNASMKEMKINSEQIARDEGPASTTQSKHDLANFRHMLAGPLLSQANLDKFCLKKGCPLLVDVKYDGERTLITYKKGEGLEMISRNSKPQDAVYHKLHQIIADQLEKTDIQSIGLDGQIVAIDRNTLAPLPFGDLLKQKKPKSNEATVDIDENSNVMLLVYIFDVVERNGENLLQKPLIERRKLIPQLAIFRTAEHRIVHFPEQRAKIFEFFRDVLERKYEGLIIKGCNDFYFTNDSRSHWKKLKRGFASSRDARISKIELDLVVMGANRGQGSKNSKLFTSYLLGTTFKGKIVPISNVGSGLTEEMISLIAQYVSDNQLKADNVPIEYQLGGVRADVYFKPSLVFEVNAQELTVSPLYKLGAGEFGGLSLRFPVFKGIRTDKGVNEATTGEEILQLSKAYNFNLPA